MPSTSQRVYLVRHGETAWSLTGQHTGRSDIPLTKRGEDNARRIGQRLQGATFVRVLVSPLQRARRTCELAGFGAVAEVAADLAEWNYGAYEGLTSAAVQEQAPGWNLFRDGCPGGETVEQVGQRVDRVIARARQETEDVLLFAHAHVLRVLAVRWLGQSGDTARFFLLDTATLSILGYEHHRPDQPAICLWNDDRHLGP